MPQVLGLYMWKARSADEAVYAQVIGVMRGLIEVWTCLGVTEDVNEDAKVWKSRRLSVDYRTAKKVTMNFWADTAR